MLISELEKQIMRSEKKKEIDFFSFSHFSLTCEREIQKSKIRYKITKTYFHISFFNFILITQGRGKRWKKRRQSICKNEYIQHCTLNSLVIVFLLKQTYCQFLFTLILVVSIYFMSSLFWFIVSSIRNWFLYFNLFRFIVYFFKFFIMILFLVF